MAGGSVDFRTNPRNFIIGYLSKFTIFKKRKEKLTHIFNLVMKGVLLLEYSLIFIVTLGAHFHSSRKPFATYVGVCVISILLWALSFKYQGTEQEGPRFALWYLSIVIELVAHVALQKNSRVSLAASHLGERFGLFTLIILGENCMGFINMATEASLTPSVM
jgi:low temperature requirement protein LtrA